MSSNPHNLLFIQETEALYTTIEQWLTDVRLRVQRDKKKTTDNAVGWYSTADLIIEDNNGVKLAIISPANNYKNKEQLNIRGAKGVEIIIYNHKKNGPFIQTTIHSGAQSVTSTNYTYENIDEIGWYIVENISRGKKAYLLDKKLFFKLIEKVSGYEIAIY